MALKSFAFGQPLTVLNTPMNWWTGREKRLSMCRIIINPALKPKKLKNPKNREFLHIFYCIRLLMCKSLNLNCSN